MLGLPAPTPYDLRFRLLGIPVSVHPLFWLTMGILGWDPSQPRNTLIWIACGFLSILVHEYGHGLMARAFGHQAAISLFWMGGLCASEPQRETPWQRLAIIASGPTAGFLLAGLVFGLHYFVLRHQNLGWAGQHAVIDLLYINIAWGLLNLLPIWPLDGGQIAATTLGMINRRHGARWAHILSLVTAGSLAALAAVWLKDNYLTIFFALFAVTNYQALQAHQQFARYGMDEESDWWRR